MKIIFFFLAYACGVAMSTQSAINTLLKGGVKNPWLSSFISFLVGTVILGITVLIVRQPIPTFSEVRSLEWYKFLGGALGAFFVTVVIFAVPQIGPAAMFGFIIAGQMTSSVLLEQFGWLGVKQSPISVVKTIGVILIIAGAIMVNRK